MDLGMMVLHEVKCSRGKLVPHSDLRVRTSSRRATKGKLMRKRAVLNNILRRKANWIGHILRRNCPLHNVIEGQMTEVKGVGRRRTQLLDDLGNRIRYWELKEEAEDRKKMETTLYQKNISKKCISHISPWTC